MEQKIEITKKEYEEFRKVQESRKNQYKRQNKFIAENFDRVSLALPQGTVARIRKITKESLNGYITNLILSDLENLEEILNCENPNFEDQEQPEEFSEPVPEVPEPIVEPQKEADELVEKVEEKPKNAEFRPMTPEEIEELEALIKNQLGKQKAYTEKLEQDKQKQLEAEQAAKEAEIMGYVEKMRAAQDGIREARSAQDKKKIAAVLADAELLAIIREPSNRDCLVEQIGEELYNAILQADKEKQRQESIDRATAEMGQASKPPF